MKKRILAMLLALVMVLSVSPSYAFATEVTDGKIDTVDELTAAITNAKAGDTITLSGNIATTAYFTIDKDITLDLNGHSISRDHTNVGAVTLMVTSTGVTVHDSAETNGDGIVNTGRGIAIWVAENAALTLYDVNVTGSDVGVLVDGGNLTLNSGVVVKGTNTIDNCGDCIRAYNAVVTVNEGAQIEASDSGSGIESYGTSTVTMNGTITAGARGVEVCGGTVTINGNVTAPTAIFYSIVGDANSEDSDFGNATVNVTGGTITATTVVDSNIAEGSETTYTQTTTISGGTFSTKPESTYLANGFELKENTDGTYGVAAKVYPETVSFWGENLELGNTLNMAFIFAKDQRADWTGYTAKVTMNGETTTYTMDQWKTDSTGDYYYIYFTGIYAKEMTDEITVVIYDAEGNAVSETFKTSIKEYGAELMVEDSTKKDMVIALLNYGAEAQKIFGYKTDKLANAGLN